MACNPVISASLCDNITELFSQFDILRIKEAIGTMKQYVCSVCSYTYDESIGIPEAGIAPGTKWDDLPSDWKCPWCGAGKEAFKEKGAAAAAVAEKPHVEREMSPMEMSIVCSNLARGCEKQYRAGGSV